MSSFESGWNWKIRLRLTRALLTAKNGFSRRRPDEDHVALLHVRQEHVLLGLVEAMDLVDEQQRPLAAWPTGDRGPPRAPRAAP